VTRPKRLPGPTRFSTMVSRILKSGFNKTPAQAELERGTLGSLGVRRALLSPESAEMLGIGSAGGVAQVRVRSLEANLGYRSLQAEPNHSTVCSMPHGLKRFQQSRELSQVNAQNRGANLGHPHPSELSCELRTTGGRRSRVGG
jgi:hypothetical protein